MKWIIYKRGTIYPYRSEMYLRGVFYYCKKFNGNFVETLYLNRGKVLWWTWNEKQLHQVGERIIRLSSDKKLFSKHLSSLEKVCTEAIKGAGKIRKTNLGLLSNQDLIKKYEFLDKAVLPANGFLGVDVDAFDIVFEKFFMDEIKKELKEKRLSEDFNIIYKKLSRPLYLSYSIRQEKEILELALKKKNNPFEIEKLYEKLWWTKLGWENGTPYNKEYFIREINKFKKSGNAKEKLCKINLHEKESKKDRKFVIKKYKISSHIKYLLSIVDKYHVLHEKRKEQQVKSMNAYFLLLSEIARRLKLSVGDLVWLWQDEIKELLLGGKLDKAEIALRKRAVGLWATESGIKSFSGKEANEVYLKNFSSLVDEKIKIVRGLGGNEKKAKGKVKVCAGAEEAIKNIKKGDVLICPMTLPDYLPAMKRACAIVTDEGGITCHAAIISRELGIPCVVGTKIATKVFKNDDLVEVDANHGIVKLLKRNKVIIDH